MQYSNASAWPQTAPLYKGNVFSNGILAGPKEASFLLGGYSDINDVNNTLSVIPFGTLMSTLAATPDLYVIGQASGSYILSGIAVASEQEMQNEPFKSGGYLLGEGITVCTAGYVRYNTWQKVNTPTPIDPVKGCAVVFNNTTGEISFTAQATTTTGVFVKLAQTQAVVMDVDPPGGLTGTGTSVLIHFTLQ